MLEKTKSDGEGIPGCQGEEWEEVSMPKDSMREFSEVTELSCILTGVT